MAKKKEKTVDELIADYQKMGDKPFEKRIEKFEELHDQDKAHQMKFLHHAEYIVNGKPSDTKSFPGAYNEAYKILDKAADSDTDKIDNLDSLTEMMEKYVDVFLEKAMGEGFKKHLDSAEKGKLSKEEIRNMKGKLFQMYHIGEEGKTIPNILDEKYIKRLKGKRKIDLVNHLKMISGNSIKMYGNYLLNKAQQHLIKEYDLVNLHEYTTPLFKKAGFKHENHALTRNVEEIIGDYGSLLQGGNLNEKGYKRIKEDKKKKKAD